MKNKLIKYGALIAVVIVLLTMVVLPVSAASLNIISETYDYDVLSTLGQTMNGVQTATLDLTGTSSSGTHDTISWTYFLDNIVAPTYFVANQYNGRYFWLQVGGNGDAALQRASFYTADIDLINPTNIYCTCWSTYGSWQIQFKVDYYDAQGNYLERVSQSYDITSTEATYTFSPSVASGEVKFARVYLNFYNDTDTSSSAIGRFNIRAFGFDYSVPVDELYYQGYQDGYQFGLEIGETNGYNNGYEDGYNIGYNEGVTNSGSGDYQDGYNAGYEQGIVVGESSAFGNNLLGSTLNGPINALNSFVLFSYNGIDVTLGGVVGAVIALSLFIIFLKMFAGG